MRKNRIVMALVLILAGCPLSICATIELMSAKSVIVIPERGGGADARDRQRAAQGAEELQTHLELVTGEAPKIISGRKNAPQEMYPFYVGFRIPEDKEKLKTGEARWQVTSDGAYFYGNHENNELGTLAAVYDFLENRLGIRWVEPGETGIFYKRQSPLKLAEGTKSWTPKLQFRKIRHGIRRDDILLWQQRMRMGGTRPGGGHAFADWWKKYGFYKPSVKDLAKSELQTAPAEADTDIPALDLEDNGGGTKNKADIMAKRIAEATTREVFAMQADGTRGCPGAPPSKWENVKICPSSPKVVELLIKEWLPDKERRRYLSACVNDGTRGFCRCKACQALDVRKPGEAFGEHLTDRYVYLANAVARAAREYRPDAMVATYAYMKTLWPPRRERVEPNVVVHVVPYVIPLEKGLTEKLLHGWKEAGAHYLAFRPNYHHKYHTVAFPLGLEKQMFDIFQIAVENGCISADYDMLMNHWPISGNADYILARSMSEPERPFSYWEDHYCAGYGAAAGDIKAYFRYWREEIWDKRLQPNMERILTLAPGGSFGWAVMRALIRYRDPDWKPEGCDHLYAPADFDYTDEILKRALGRKGLAEAQKEKISQLVLANRHSRLMFNALTAGAEDKKAHAEALRDFRNENETRLRLSWGHVGWFERERLRNATGVIVRYYDEQGKPLPHRDWVLSGDKE